MRANEMNVFMFFICLKMEGILAILGNIGEGKWMRGGGFCMYERIT